jgi:hypothetical protein
LTSTFTDPFIFTDTTIDTSEYVQCVKIDSSIFGTDTNVLLGNIYIPPENTKYSCLDAFNEIESEMFQLSEHSDLIGLLGDINAKTGKLLDYVETDKSLLNIFDLQDDVDLINYMYDYENISSDTKFCKYSCDFSLHHFLA